MIANDLSAPVWNAIADLVQRSQLPREVYFCKVTKIDRARQIIWTEDFGAIGIPMVAHTFSFAYYDTTPTDVQHRDDPGNPAFQVKIVMPKVGQVVIVLDPWGAKRFPICVGVIQSKSGYWEGG